MARKSLDELQSDLDSVKATANSGQKRILNAPREVQRASEEAKAPVSISQYLQDVFDTMRPAGAALDLDIEVGVPVTATPTIFTAWNEDVNTDTTALEADRDTGLITLKVAAVARFSVNMNAELGNNVQLVVEVVKSTGSSIEYRGSTEGSGSGIAQNIAFSGIFFCQANDTVEVRVSRGSGSSTIDFQECNLVVDFAPFVEATVERD